MAVQLFLAPRHTGAMAAAVGKAYLFKAADGVLDHMSLRIEDRFPQMAGVVSVETPSGNPQAGVSELPGRVPASTFPVSQHLACVWVRNQVLGVVSRCQAGEQ